MEPSNNYSEWLFSYGTLQYPKVQKETFGRLLEGKSDKLIGYTKSKLKIHDLDVINKSGEDEHIILKYTGNQEDSIDGMIFNISLEELQHADKYEVDDYKRIKVKLASGKDAWVYVG